MNQARAAAIDGAQNPLRWICVRIDGDARSALRALPADATLAVGFNAKTAQNGHAWR
jgi:hypothetical protein